MRIGRAVRHVLAFLMAIVYVQGETVRKVEESSDSQLAQKRYLKGQINKGHEEGVRVLLYMTTHMSQLHKDFLQFCWPTAIKRSSLLQNADVLFFSTEDPDPIVVSSIFKTNNVTVQKYNNPGYQSGSILAMKEAVKNGWFDGYDWVVRLNPDVIIRNDNWILETMLDETAEGIFVDCFDECVNGLRHCKKAGKIHTDFFAVRPNSLTSSSFQSGGKQAEILATKEFMPIIERGGDTWLPQVGPHRTHCRVRGSRAPVLHDHYLVEFCKKGIM